MSEQRIRQELDALDADAPPWWAWNLPEDGPPLPPLAGSDAAYGVKDASGPVSPGTIGARLEAVRARKRRMTWHALLCFAVALVFAVALASGAEPVLASGVIYFLGGGACAAFLLAPSFVRGFAREEKRLMLYRFLAARYDGS